MSTMAAEGSATTPMRAVRTMFEDKGRQALPAGANRTAAVHHPHGGSSSSTGIEPHERQQAKPQAGHVTTPVHGGFQMQAAAAAIASAAAAAAAAASAKQSAPAAASAKQSAPAAASAKQSAPAAASAKQSAPPPVMSKPIQQGPPPPPKIQAKGSVADTGALSGTANDGPETCWPQPPPEAYSGCAAANASPADDEVSGGGNLLTQTMKVALKPPLSPGGTMSTFKKRQSTIESPTEATRATASVGSAEAPIITTTAASAAAMAATPTSSLTDASIDASSARATPIAALAERASREQSQRLRASLLPLLPVKPPRVPDQATGVEPKSAAVEGEPPTHKHTEDDHSTPAQGGKRPVKVAPPLPSKPFTVATAAPNAASENPLHAATTAAAGHSSMVTSPSPSQDGIRVMDSYGAIFTLLPFHGNKGQSAASPKPASFLDASDVQLPRVLWADDAMLGSSAQSEPQKPWQQWQTPVTLRTSASSSSSSQPSPRERLMSVVSLIEPTTEAEEYDDCFFPAAADGPAVPLSAPALPSKSGINNRPQPPPPRTRGASTDDTPYDDTACASAYDDTRSAAMQESAFAVSSSDGRASTSAAQKREMKRREKQEQEQRDREAREQAEEKERRNKEIERMAKIRQALQKDQNKIRKRLKLSDDETYVRLVTMRSRHVPKCGNEELPYQAHEVLYVILKEGCPKGKWLARNSENLMGFISCDQVVQTSVSGEQDGAPLEGDMLYDDTVQAEELEDDEVYTTMD